MSKTLDVLLYQEWKAPYDTCPSCGGSKPSLDGIQLEGHEHWCELANHIESFGGEAEYIEPTPYEQDG